MLCFQMESAQRELQAELADLSQLRSNVDGVEAKLNERLRSLRKKRLVRESRLHLIERLSESIEGRFRALAAQRHGAMAVDRVERDPGEIRDLLTEIGRFVRKDNARVFEDLKMRSRNLIEACDGLRDLRSAWQPQLQLYVGNAAMALKALTVVGEGAVNQTVDGARDGGRGGMQRWMICRSF
jgi:hypothetical protein